MVKDYPFTPAGHGLMMKLMQRNPRIFLLTVLFVMVSTTGAWAQGAPSPAPEYGVLVSWGIALVAALALVALSVMSAKRNHQD